MSHFSEMDFLFNRIGPASPTGIIEKAVTPPLMFLNNSIVNSIPGSRSIFYEKNDNITSHYVIFKGVGGTKNVKNYIKDKVYKTYSNPYIKIIEDFNGIDNPTLKIKASDLAYLRELGVHPINRMVILRRFEEGQLVTENLEDMKSKPISTVIGWLKPDENFGSIDFNETWTNTHKRLDEMISQMVKENFFKGSNLQSIMPVPGFARGLLFELLKRMGLVGGEGSDWSWNNIPIGDPNVLSEGPYRDPNSQNISSEFQFTFETTYEQKFIGDVDPGAAMIDIIDNLLKIGTSNMKYWLNGKSSVMVAAKDAAGSGDDIDYWWKFVNELLKSFWKAIKDIFNEAAGLGEGSKEEKIANAKNLLRSAAQTILTASIAKYRWEIKGSIELMTGSESVTPWYLTIGNPYTPWIATNHIIVTKVKIDTSPEVGFNDMPMWLKATFMCSQSRNLGRNEIIKMFNNSFLREYTTYKPSEYKADTPTVGTGSGDEEKQGNDGEGEGEGENFIDKFKDKFTV